jgi:hypothetical protein
MSCCKDSFRDQDIVVNADIKYGEGAGWRATNPNVPLYLDLYYAAQMRNKTKAVMICVHGGGFMNEMFKNAANTVAEAKAWARRGFLAVSVEYRQWGHLVNKTDLTQIYKGHSDPVYDVLAAIRYIVSKKDFLFIDPHRIALSGTSAGAITISHAAILNLGEGNSGNPGYPSNVSLVIVQSGGLSPYQLDKPRKTRSQIPPYFAIHNLNDTTVLYSQANATKVILDNLGVVNDIYSVPGRDHTPSPFTTQGRDNDNMFQDMAGFATRYMRVPGCFLVVNCPVSQMSTTQAGSSCSC